MGQIEQGLVKEKENKGKNIKGRAIAPFVLFFCPVYFLICPTKLEHEVWSLTIPALLKCFKIKF